MAKKQLTPQQQEYQKLHSSYEKKRPVLKNCIYAFFIGGFICLIGQCLHVFFIRILILPKKRPETRQSPY